MLNIDKYRKEIDRVLDEPMITPCIALDRVYRDATGSTSGVAFGEVLNWLFSEYEPPLLKNGDDLKPGDWIMVRKNGDGVWENRQFLAYFDGWFYARKIVPDGWIEKIDRFRQARLPEDGE